MVNPKTVVPRARKLGVLVALTLIAGFVAYSIFTVVSNIKQRDNPPTQAKLVKKLYKQPVITVCPNYDFNDFNWMAYDCFPYLTPSTTGSNICPLLTDANVDEELPANCVFPDPEIGDACSELVETEGGDPCLHFNTNRTITMRTRKESIEIYLKFNWTANLTNEPIPDTSPQEFYVTRVAKQLLIYFREDMVKQPLVGETPETIGFPGAVTLSLQRAEYNFLKKSKNYVDYSVTVSSTEVLQDVADVNNVSGTTIKTGVSDILLVIRLNALTVQIVEEQDPVDPNVLVGVLSGFWGFVGVAWGFIFVPTESERVKPFWDKGGDEEEPTTESAKVGDATEMAPTNSAASNPSS